MNSDNTDLIAFLVPAIREEVSLTDKVASNAFELLLTGDVDPAVGAEFLIALAERGESATEIVSLYNVLKNHCTTLKLDGTVMDVCGTGGSGLTRFNVSTTVAFVLASDGVSVAKHGNRGSRTSNGSFDLLEVLGCPFQLSPSALYNIHSETNLCFIYARLYHPAMKAVACMRSRAGRRTVFNLAAPLCNPSEPEFQMVGVSSLEIGKVVADILMAIGSRGLVVCGAPGIDEVSTCGETMVFEVAPQCIKRKRLWPEMFGLLSRPFKSIPCGNAETNATLFNEVLTGRAEDSLSELVSASAGAAFYCRGVVGSVAEGVRRATRLIADGTVVRKFEEFRAISLEVLRSRKSR